MATLATARSCRSPDDRFPPFAQLGLQAFRQPLQQTPEAKIRADLFQTMITDLSIETEVVGDISAEQKSVLEDNPQLLPEIGDRNRPDVLPIEENAAPLGFIEAAEQANHCGFP